MERRELVDHDESAGWQLTRVGREFYVRMYREITLVARGHLRDISKAARELLEKHGR
jgi:Mn-dependent DtxR family transcriptional regulator